MAYKYIQPSTLSGLPAQTTGTQATGLLSMPSFTYDSSKLATDKDGKLKAHDMLGDYYKQMAETYLPAVDTFAHGNTGKMVAFDPNKLMSIEDFGLGVSRGDLRGADLSKASHSTGFGNDAEGNLAVPYYTRTANGLYLSATGKEGDEMFTLSRTAPTWQNPEGADEYTSAGKYHKETAQEAAARLLGQGGGYATGDRKDFMGETTLTDLTTKAKDKWGQDFVNMPELKPYLDDPAWVTKTDGKVTAIRAELMPYLVREAIGEEYRDMTRGMTKSSDGIGTLIKGVLLTVVTGGIGSGLAGAMGFTGTTASIAGGAIGGGMSSALTGGNILQGAALGGLSSGVSPMVSKVMPGTAGSTLNKSLTQGVMGGAKAAITGGNVGDAMLTSGIAGGINATLGLTGIAGQVAGTVVGSLVNNLVTGGVKTPTNITSTGSTTTAPAGSDKPATVSFVPVKKRMVTSGNGINYG